MTEEISNLIVAATRALNAYAASVGATPAPAAEAAPKKAKKEKEPAPAVLSPVPLPQTPAPANASWTPAEDAKSAKDLISAFTPFLTAYKTATPDGTTMTKAWLASQGITAKTLKELQHPQRLAAIAWVKSIPLPATVAA